MSVLFSHLVNILVAHSMLSEGETDFSIFG